MPTMRTAADLENLRKRQKRELDDVRLESKGRVLIGEFELDRYTPLVAPHLHRGTPPSQQ